MQKTLIIQVEVGGTGGYVYNPNVSPDAKAASKLFDKLTTTVERYCKTHGYDYKKITEYPKDLDITYFNYSSKGENYDFSTGGKNKCSTLIRYLNMHDDKYDAIVTLDNDIWIPIWAEPLPEIKGHHGVEDLGKDYSGFNSQFGIPFNKFINGGVQMVNKKAGQSICQYITEAVKNKTRPIGNLHTDQSFMNHWRAQNIHHAYLLPIKWNYMVDCHERTFNYKDYNFVHYAGWKGRTTLIQDYSKGIIE